MTQQGMATRAPEAGQPERWAGRIVFWALGGLALAVLLASVAFLIVTINPYFEQSTSMQPTISPGDRILAVQGSSGIRRGDVVVLRVPAKISGTDDLFVKRVIGLPGDHVACCDAGRVTVNGKPLDESYLYPGDPPSRTTFSVTVGKGEIWVMGDHRNISVDSRKWGPVPVSGVVGRVILIGHGSSFTAVRTPRTFVADGLAPADTRPELYAGLLIAAAASVAVLMLLAVAGITRFVIRRSRPGPRPGGPGPRPADPEAAPAGPEPAHAGPEPAPAGPEPAPAGPEPAPAGQRPLVKPLYGVYRVPPDGDPPADPPTPPVAPAT